MKRSSTIKIFSLSLLIIMMLTLCSCAIAERDQAIIDSFGILNIDNRQMTIDAPSVVEAMKVFDSQLDKVEGLLAEDDASILYHGLRDYLLIDPLQDDSKHQLTYINTGDESAFLLSLIDYMLTYQAESKTHQFWGYKEAIMAKGFIPFYYAEQYHNFVVFPTYGEAPYGPYSCIYTFKSGNVYDVLVDGDEIIKVQVTCNQRIKELFD